MNRIRLLPVVVLAIAALLVLKTMGLVTNGGYVLTGVGTARAAGGGGGHGGGEGGTTETDMTLTPTAEPTLQDTSPTIADEAPTLGAEPAAAGGHGAPAAADHGAAPAAEAAAGDHGAAPAAPTPTAVAASTPGLHCVEADATLTESGEAVILNDTSGGGHGAPAADHGAAETPAEGHGEGAEAVVIPEGSFASSVIDCLPSGDAVPTELGPDGKPVAIGTASDTAAGTEQQLLERLTARRTELQQYEQDLALRASIVDAAEKRIEERAATLQALETQISTLVDQRTEMETGQFASIVAMYENMRPKDAANIFNNLDMAVLLQVAKTMSPRKMAPIMAAMDAARAQELTVAMADLSAQPPTEMTPDDLAALPQIVGQ